MKLKIYSQTGKPINVENAKIYEQKFKDAYDVLWKRLEAKEVTMDDFKVELDKVDKGLAVQFPMYELVEMPKSGKQWKKLVLDFGYPITLAITQETKEVALFLMDAEY